MWIELVCAEGERIDRTGYLPNRAQRRYSAQLDVAKALISKLADDSNALILEAPAKRVRKEPSSSTSLVSRLNEGLEPKRQRWS